MTISVKDAQADLLGLIRRLTPGDTLILTDNDVPVMDLPASEHRNTVSAPSSSTSTNRPEGCGLRMTSAMTRSRGMP